MKQYILLSATLLIYNANLAIKESFLIKKDGLVLINGGDCHERHSPCSTFKIPLSLMGYNENILKDEYSPNFDYDANYQDSRVECRQACNPLQWIRLSCVWYSQEITKRLGFAKFQFYINQWNYGNQDISGDINKNNGLMVSWLSSSLKISVEEQVEFLEKLLHKKLAIRDDTYKKTHNILFLEEFSESFKLYGKSGFGAYLNQDGTLDFDHQFSWFIGWLENNTSEIIFALYIENEAKEEISGEIAKKLAKKKLLQITNH